MYLVGAAAEKVHQDPDVRARCHYRLEREGLRALVERHDPCERHDQQRKKRRVHSTRLESTRPQ